MSLILNKRAFEHAKALVKAGRYEDAAWTFSAEEGNALLGEKGRENWTTYGMWFLGCDPTAAKDSKAAWSHPYGKGETVSLAALREIASRAAKAGDHSIAEAAEELLDSAKAKDADRSSPDGQAAAGPFDFYATGERVDIRADLSGPTDSDGRPQLHRFSMVAYTGGPMMLKGSRKDLDYSKPIIVDLDGMSGIDRNRPALRDHNQSKPVGHTEEILAAGGVLTARGVISNPYSTDAMEIVSSSKNGFPWQCSIGANIVAHEFVPAGKSADVNGRTFPGPFTIARKTVLGEISFVALGADDSTSAVVASRQLDAKGTPTMKFKAWAKAKGFTDSELEGEMCKGLRAAWKASADYDAEDDQDGEGDGKGGDGKGARDLDTQAGAKPDVQASQGVADIRAEGLRLAAVNAAVDVHAAKVESGSDLGKKLADLRAEAIRDGWTGDRTATQAELLALRSARAPVQHQDGTPFHIHTGGNGPVVDNDVIAASAALACGVPEKIALTRRDGTKLSEQQGNVAVSGRMRVMGVQRIMAIVAGCHGLHIPAGPMDEDTVKAILHAERRMEILGASSGGFSTVSLLGITENIMNKAMLQAYGDVPSVIEQIAYQTDTNDFKAFKRYRLTASGKMERVSDAGELKSKGLQDETYANQVDTWGMVISITRKHIINDDMSALTDTPKLIGREAAMTREEQVFTTFLAARKAGVFFTAALGNYISGATTALSYEAVSAAVKAFLEQKDANDRPINLIPDRLMVPPALKEAADRIYGGQGGLIVTALGATNAKALDASKNTHAGLYKPVVSPFLAAMGGKGLDGSSDTAWTLLCNPASGAAVVQIGYLRGQRVPVIERGEAPFTTLGIQLRGFYDFGVAMHDYRAGVDSKGAA